MNETRTEPPPQEKGEAGNLDSMIAAAEGDLAAGIKMRKSSRIVELAALALVSALYLASSKLYIPFLSEDQISRYYFPVVLIAAVFAALYLLIREAYFRMRVGRLEATLELLKAKKRFHDQLPSAEARPETKDYFDALVRINVDNLAGYYNLVRIQTDRSFMAVLAMGVAGFVLLAAGLVLGFTNSARMDLMGYISSGAGVMTEFIAAVFFYLYNQTIQQMKSYHDSLLDVQNVLLALKLVDDTEQSSDRIKMIGQMLAYLLSKRAAVQREEARPPTPELLKAAGM